MSEESTNMEATPDAGSGTGAETQTQNTEAAQVQATPTETVNLLGGDGQAQPTQQTTQTATDIEYKLEVPDGLDINQDAFTAQAKELGWSNEQANKMLTLISKDRAAQKEAHIKQINQWAEEVQAHPELGGDNFDATIMHANATLKRFDGDGELYKMLTETGYVNHPTVVRILSLVGKAHAEDGFIDGKTVENKPARHERLYGKYNNM